MSAQKSYLVYNSMTQYGEQGWRSGESTHLPPVWPGFHSRHRCRMWVKFVVGSFPCSKRFFSSYSGFPLSSKTNISKLQFDQESGRRRTTMWMCYLQIVIYLFNFLFIYLYEHPSDIRLSTLRVQCGSGLPLLCYRNCV